MSRNEIDATQRRIALTEAYLKVVRSSIDSEYADKACGFHSRADRRRGIAQFPAEEITDAQAIEIV